MRARRPIPAVLLALALPIAASGDGFDPWTQGARYAFRYRVDLAAIAAEPGDQLRLWLPAPARTADQERLELRVEAPFEALRGRDELGNEMIHLAWEGPAPEGAEVVLHAVVERAPSRGTPREAAASGSPDDPGRYRGAARRIPLDGVIAQLAARQSRGLDSDRDKIRTFYDYVTKTMRYSKHGEGWGRGDAVWACTAKYGNCTDFHSLFLGMARSQGIPARFVIGFPVPPAETSADVAGYHCWSEAWDAERGWLPVDASEAWKSRRFEDYFGTLPSDRIAFTTGRDLVLVPPQAGEPLNFFVYPYAERNGKPVEGIEGRYHVRRLAAEPEMARR